MTTGRSLATISSPVSMIAEAHLVELAQEVVRELEVGLVDLVDQEHLALVGRERLPERPELDVAADVGDVAGAEAAVVQALDGVVDVQTVGGLATST